MNVLLRKKYLVGFALFYLLYIVMHILVNWRNVHHIENSGNNVFSNLSIYDYTLAPPLFAIKFLYLAIFIFSVFLLFDKPITFEDTLSAVVLSSLFFYLPQLINLLVYVDTSKMLTYGELKNYNWTSVLFLLPNSNIGNIALAYLKEFNLCVLSFLLIISHLINIKNKKYYTTLGLISLGYFSAMYFATTVITFLSILLVK